MGYYGTRAGDYYRAGGLFGFLGKAVKGVLNVATGGIAGTVIDAVSSLGGHSSPSSSPPPTVQQYTGGMVNVSTAASAGPGGQRPGRHKEPGVTGLVHRLVPGGHTGYIGGRKMNTLNPKALSRATRRIKGFEKKAKHALRALGLHVGRPTCKHASHGRRSR